MRVIDFFDQGAQLYPKNLAFVDDQGETSYAEAYKFSIRLAAGIRAHGYPKSSKVGVFAPNSSIAFMTLLGLYRSESVWLPINPRNTVSANADLLERFDGELLFYHSVFESQALELKAKVPSIKDVVCIDKGLDGWMPDVDHFEMDEEDPDGVFAIFPTGGTTGAPKGVVVLHRNLETMFSNYWAHFKYHDNTRHLVVAPMTHSSGALGCAHFARGGTNYIMGQVDPEGILKSIQEHKITHLFLPPTVLYMMLALPAVRDYDYSSLQHFLVAAAPCSLAKLKEAIEVFGPVMTEAFGQTEAPAAITAKAPWDYLDASGSVIESRLRSIGRPCVLNKVVILDDEGRVLPAGEAGEICVRSRLVTQGYYKNPEATAEVRKFGWHHTGDIGVMDEDGYITIVDRKKDMIISGGFNVFPNEIEQLICQLEPVQDCGVIGVPDEKWGETVKAVVLLKPGMSLTEEALISYCKEHLGSVKAPKSVDFVGELPLSPAGKVLKTELRKVYWRGFDRAVN
ncbi:class I adenylate-forming enzyme family protein [Spongiibacter marinus]|uniref:class I adenylate-forming enzyme family protein n=1 Tax=Spongiibacter marinus TaxID=354246 RepID=UPI0035BE4DE5